MPLTFEKCGVMHCGVKQPNYTCSIHDCSMTVFEFFKDLGIMKSSNGLHNGQCQAAATKASKIFGVIRRIFQRKSPNLLWPAYCSYILPVLMYGSQAWNLSLCKDEQCIESVQRRFTKSVQGLHNLSYEERLLQLNALSLINCKLLDDVAFSYKVIHGFFNCSAADLDLHVLHSRTRGDGVWLAQKRAVSCAESNLHSIRSPSAWNKLPLDITRSPTLYTFKRNLKKYLLNLQLN